MKAETMQQRTNGSGVLNDTNETGHAPSANSYVYFLRLGTVGFGGPVALCGQMERELVAGRGWLTQAEMREAIAVSQSLPGPLAIQVGIFISYMRGGFWGAWAGGWAFILPNFLIVAALGALYVHFGGLSWMTAIFYGVSPAVIALILHSCWRLAKLGMEDWLQWADRRRRPSSSRSCSRRRWRSLFIGAGVARHPLLRLAVPRGAADAALCRVRRAAVASARRRPRSRDSRQAAASSSSRPAA